MADTTTEPAAARQLRQRIDAALREALVELTQRLAAADPALREAGAALEGFATRGGKRLRPLFVLLGHRIGGGAVDDTALPAALAVELVHTCALIHDDLIDAAAARRGQPTLHRQFAALHHETGFLGDAERFGAAAAILLGDLALAYAHELLRRCEVPAPRLAAAAAVFTDLEAELVAGQYLDVLTAHRGDRDPALAERIAGLKSGRYTVARPLELGARLAGAPEPVIETLRAVGIPLGTAFQLRDDVLGVFGDPDVTGKPAGGDLVEGKRTLLVAETLERLDDPGRQRFLELFGRPLTAPEAAELRDLIERSGARAAVEQRIAVLRGQALRALEALPPSPAVELLGELARYATTRSS